VLATAGAGKTAQSIQYLIETTAANRFAKVWVLLASRRQEAMFRQRLLTHPNAGRVYFNITFFDFYDLYHHLLDEAGSPQHRISDAVRFRILRLILQQLEDKNILGEYVAIAHRSGFVRVVADFIYELKQNHVEPDVFMRATTTEKNRVLATIYRDYQDTLQKYDLVDREGEGWLALAKLRESPQIARDVDLLIVDGFDHFTQVQSDLVALLSSRATDTVITLTHLSGRDGAVGRRFLRTFEQLSAIDALEKTALKTAESRPTTLQHLLDSIFVARQNITPIAVDSHIHFIEAPDTASETGAILRRVKRLLVTQQCEPDDIVIVLRDWARYQSHFAAQGRAFKIPMALHLGEPLAENPAIIALLNVLTLHEDAGHVLAFGWRALLDALRSPYFNIPHLDTEQVDLLEQISREFLVRGGRNAWLQAIEAAQYPRLDEDDTERAALLTAEEAEKLRDALAQFFDRVTPPRQHSVAGYVRWLENLIGHDPALEDEEAQLDEASLNILAQLRAGEADVAARDLAAIQTLQRVLRGLVAAQRLIDAFEGDQIMRWDEFRNDLLTMINTEAVDRQPYRDGLVLVTTATDARGLPHKHVFIPGLAEGVFPAQISEDPLYLDSERENLINAGIPVQVQSERTADDSLFYELIGLAHESLTLSRPTLQDGVPWVESHLWREVCAVFDDVEQATTTLSVGQAADVDEVAGIDEAALVVAQQFASTTIDAATAKLYNWLVTEHGVYWQHIHAARQVEQHRAMRQLHHDEYTGQLTDMQIIDEVRARLGNTHIWSASQFNEYGACGFRFFAKRLLKLEELEEIEDGIDARQLGTLNHAILEKTYLHLRDEGIAIAPNAVENAVEILHDVAHAEFADAPQRMRFHAALWEQEKTVILRQLINLVQLDFSEDSPVVTHFGAAPRYPYAFEAPFGVAGDSDFVLELDGEPLRITGFIDRMDRVGDAVVVIDYKTGSTRIPIEEMKTGRNFQMMLYLLAAQHLIEHDTSANAPTTIAGGMFWHIRSNDPSGVFKFGKDDDALRIAQDYVAQYIRRARDGNFAVAPPKLEDGKCTRYCEFYRLCRLSVTNRYKSASGVGTS